MEAIERLKRDHTVLRAKLDVLEAALRMGAETWYVLREICYTLGRQLRDHIQREEVLVAACRERLRPELLAHLNVEHHDEPEHLRTLSRLFVTESGRSLGQVRPLLTRLIRDLRQHMAEEEADLFPAFERLLEAPESCACPPGPACLHKTMTPNHIVHDHPETRQVFDALFISLPFEGCDCLDEVAWRHGMGADELIARLEQSIAMDSLNRGGGSQPLDSEPTLTVG